MSFTYKHRSLQLPFFFWDRESTKLAKKYLGNWPFNGPLQEEMSTWIQAILNAGTPDKVSITPSNQSTPASSRAQTLPATVTLTTESSPGKREKDKEKDKEKRFSLFGKKKL